MADVIAIIVADVIATLLLDCIWLMLLPILCGRYYCHWGWCYCLPKFVLADVIAKIVAAVITTILNVLADGIAKWQME